jgi:hypothetical protein
MNFRVTCEACPLQIEGDVNGRSFYFRARSNRWSLHSPNPYEGVDWDSINAMTQSEARRLLELERTTLIDGGGTDDSTVGQAIDLVIDRVDAEPTL